MPRWPLVLVVRLARGAGARWRGAWGRVGSAGSVLVGRVLVVGLGMGALLLWANGRAVGFTSNTRGPPRWGVPPPPLVGVVAPSLGGGPPPVLVGGVLGSALPPGSFLRWGGVWWLWWVVCDLYSGCEHLCCLRASPLLVSSCVRRGACGGRVARGAAVLWWWSWACFCCVWFCGAFGGCLGTKS